MGGKVQKDYTKRVTHLIAGQVGSTKYNVRTSSCPKSIYALPCDDDDMCVCITDVMCVCVGGKGFGHASDATFMGGPLLDCWP